MAAMFAKQFGLASRVDEILGRFGTPSLRFPGYASPSAGSSSSASCVHPRSRRAWVYARVAGGPCSLPGYRPHPAVECRRPTLDMCAESCLGCKWTRRPLPISPTFASRGVLLLFSAVSPAWCDHTCIPPLQGTPTIRLSIQQGGFIAADLPRPSS